MVTCAASAPKPSSSECPGPFIEQATDRRYVPDRRAFSGNSGENRRRRCNELRCDRRNGWVRRRFASNLAGPRRQGRLTTYSPAMPRQGLAAARMNANLGYGFKAYPCDVTDFESCTKASCVDAITEAVGPMDGPGQQIPGSPGT